MWDANHLKKIIQMYWICPKGSKFFNLKKQQQQNLRCFPMGKIHRLIRKRGNLESISKNWEYTQDMATH
jgi:hypothetical protein